MHKVEVKLTIPFLIFKFLNLYLFQSIRISHDMGYYGTDIDVNFSIQSYLLQKHKKLTLLKCH